MNKKAFGLAAIILFVAGACSYATNNQSTAQEQKSVNNQQDQYNNVQPIPYFDYSMQRQSLIDIYKSQNTATQTWSVVTSYTGQALFSCESEGWPIPAADQLSNGQQVVGVPGPWSGYLDGVVQQAEPNGIFTGNTLGTYVLCIRPDGKIAPIYTENEVQMFPFEVKVNPTTGAIEDAGGSSNITFNVKGGNVVTPSPLPSP